MLYFSTTSQRGPGGADGAGGGGGGGGGGRRCPEHLDMAVLEACGRLELGLWPCGHLDTMVAGPVAILNENGFGWGPGRRRR